MIGSTTSFISNSGANYDGGEIITAKSSGEILKPGTFIEFDNLEITQNSTTISGIGTSTYMGINKNTGYFIICDYSNNKLYPGGIVNGSLKIGTAVSLSMTIGAKSDYITIAPIRNSSNIFLFSGQANDGTNFCYIATITTSYSTVTLSITSISDIIGSDLYVTSAVQIDENRALLSAGSYVFVLIGNSSISTKVSANRGKYYGDFNTNSNSCLYNVSNQLYKHIVDDSSMITTYDTTRYVDYAISEYSQGYLLGMRVGQTAGDIKSPSALIRISVKDMDNIKTLPEISISAIYHSDSNYRRNDFVVGSNRFVCIMLKYYYDITSRYYIEVIPCPLSSSILTSQSCSLSGEFSGKNTVCAYNDGVFYIDTKSSYIRWIKFGERKVSKSTGIIQGVVKTTCTPTSAGEVLIL